MFSAWGLCGHCGEWTLHHILMRADRTFQAQDQVQVTGMWDGATRIRYVPGRHYRDNRILRECADCGENWWQTLTRIELTDEERWPA